MSIESLLINPQTNRPAPYDPVSGGLIVSDIAKDFYLEVQKGNIPGHVVIHKFGSNSNIGNSNLEDVWTPGGVYNWPTTGSPLEALSTDAGDTAAGLGARSITIQGLEEDTFIEITEDLIMNGLSVTSPTRQSFIRVNRTFVKETGAYATTATGENIGTISIRRSGAGDLQSEIAVEDGEGMGQSQVARFSVPANKRAYILSIHANSDVKDEKHVRLYFFQRKDADIITAPFPSKRLAIKLNGVAGSTVLKPFSPSPPFGACSMTDLWWSAIATDSGSKAEIDFELLLVDE